MDALFTQIYQLPGGLFSEGAPIFIPKGGLCKSNNGDALYGCLQLKNIDPRTVDTVSVRFVPFNEKGALLGDGVVHTYETATEPNGYFGEDELITMPANTCAFGAAVTQVEFTDGSTWQAENVLAWHVANDGYNPTAPQSGK